jgi:hypothetical protein
MKFRYLLLASSSASTSTNYNQIIQNINIPACRNCIHYIPSTYDGFDSTISKCGKYGSKNIISNEITYDFTSSCRNDENKCGLEGKDYEVEENIEMKIIKHRLTLSTPYILLFTFSILYITAYSKYL